MKNLGALELELDGLVSKCFECLTMDEWLQALQQHIANFVSCQVSIEHLQKAIGCLVPFRLPPSGASAFLVLRASLIQDLVGCAMASRVAACALAQISGLQSPPVPPDFDLQVRTDLVQLLQRRSLGSEDHSKLLDDIEADPPSLKKSRTSKHLVEMRAYKTEQVKYLLKNHIKAWKATGAIHDATQLASSICNVPIDLQTLDGALVNGTNLGRHLLILDGALDRMIAADIATRRDAGVFAGAVIATDESPPSQPRFAGLRFQITQIYIGVFQSLESWESSQDPPISVECILGDILHCNSKRGDEVSAVIDKQLERLGLSRADVLGGVGDGGGENEGKSGVHARFEAENPSYVRRRCLPHLSWRVADSAIDAAESLGVSIKALAAYLADGSTWQRLRSIAVTPKRDGGLGLFKDGSPACHQVFRLHPQAIIDLRPDSHLRVLKLLRGREDVLFQCASQDLKQRELAASTVRAVADFGSIEKRLQRSILCEVLERCMHLMVQNQKHPHLVLHDSWDAMTSQFTKSILGMEISASVLKRLNLTQEQMEAEGWEPKTWVDLVILQTVGDRALATAAAPQAFAFHKSVSDRASSHLALVAANIMRTSWLAAEMLSQDTLKAQSAAMQLIRTLSKISPAMRTPFENYVFETTSLWNNIVDFAHANPPVRLWHGRGHFAETFKFLASRFLTAPDHVLDCERMHARWQWHCLSKRALKLMNLNATLKVSRYLECHDYEFPPSSILEEYVVAEAKELKNLYLIEDVDEVAKGWRFEFLFRKRFNLSPDEQSLLDPPPPVPPVVGSSYNLAWRNYFRSIFKRGYWFSFTKWPRVVFQIAENKILAGREQRGDGDAEGRNLVVIFFEEYHFIPSHP